jgi:hypothetical protein
MQLLHSQSAHHEHLFYAPVAQFLRGCWIAARRRAAKMSAALATVPRDKPRHAPVFRKAPFSRATYRGETVSVQGVVARELAALKVCPLKTNF